MLLGSRVLALCEASELQQALEGQRTGTNPLEFSIFSSTRPQRTPTRGRTHPHLHGCNVHPGTDVRDDWLDAVGLSNQTDHTWHRRPHQYLKHVAEKPWNREGMKRACDTHDGFESRQISGFI